MIDILPYTQKHTLKRIRILRIATVIIWEVILLAVVAAALLLPTLMTVNSRYAIAIGQTERLEQSGAITKPVDVIELQQRTRLLKEKLAAPLVETPIGYIEHIQNKETSGIRLTGFAMSTTDPVLEVSGVATSRQSLQQFIAVLEADAAIEVVDSPVTNFVKSTQSQFKIVITFKPL